MNKVVDKNTLWVALNFIFPKTQNRGETYVSKSVKYKIFVDEEIVGEVGKNDNQTFLSNLKLGCKIDILKGDMNKGEVFSSFSWIVGEEFATLYLNKDTSKKVRLQLANQNRIEVCDERDWDFIDDNGDIINQDEETDTSNLE